MWRAYWAVKERDPVWGGCAVGLAAALCLTEADTTIRSGIQRLLSERTVVSPMQRKYLRPLMGVGGRWTGFFLTPWRPAGSGVAADITPGPDEVLAPAAIGRGLRRSE